MFYVPLLMLSSAMLTSHADLDRVVGLASAAYHVAQTETPLFKGPDARAKTARFYIVWTARESGAFENVIGDSGHAFGPMQVHFEWLDVVDHDYTEQFDLKGSMRTAHSVMIYLIKKCGSPRRALYAYAGGSCYPSIKTKAKVEARCALIGC